MKEKLQEMLDFIEAEFGTLLNDSVINDKQVAEFESNGQIKFVCYRNSDKYAIVSKDELNVKSYKDHYQTEDFDVYYFE